MSTFLVGLSTAIAGCLYIVHNKEAEDRGTKVVYVISAITMLYLMNSMGLDKDTEKIDEKQRLQNVENRYLIGIVVFVLFVLYGLVWPLINAGKG